MLTRDLLHDLYHTKNSYDEIHNVIFLAIKNQLTDIITNSLYSKETQNLSDYRKILVVISNWLIQNLLRQYIDKIL